jgi:hypothetical protein
LRPPEAIEEFLKFVLREGSAVSVLNVMRGWGRREGLEAYARVLLNWCTHGRFFFYVSEEDEAPVEPLLLEALKDVKDPQLRREIEEALVAESGAQNQGKREGEEGKEVGEKEVEMGPEGDGIEDSEGERARDLSVDELLRKMKELKRLRELVRKAKRGKTR